MKIFRLTEQENRNLELAQALNNNGYKTITIIKATEKQGNQKQEN